MAQNVKKEEALSEAEWKFKALFELGPIGVAYHRMIYDADGKPFDYYFIDANDSYNQLTGVSPKGMTVREAFPGIENDPFDWIGLFGHVAKTGETIRFEQYLEPNGRWYDCVGYQYKPDHFVAAFNEITKRKKAEILLKESEEKFRSFFENSIVGISMTSIAGEMHVNDAFCHILGYSPDEFKSINWRDITYKEDIEPNEKNFKTILEGNKNSMRWEKRYIHKQGHIVWVDINTSLLRDENGKALYFITAIVDITERKQQEYKIKINAKRLDALVKILQFSSDSVQDYLDYALTKVIEITESKIGYIFHYYEDKKEFVLNTWSKEVMNECKVMDQQTVYQLEKTGLWGEAVRQRKAIMVNDFQAPHPLKKGHPEGHVPLYRFLTVPVIYENKIMGVVVVANKQTNYVDEDITQLTIMMDIIWKALEKKKSELDLIKKNKDLEYMNKFMVNREVRMAEMKKEVNEMLERLGEEKRYL